MVLHCISCAFLKGFSLKKSETNVALSKHLRALINVQKKKLSVLKCNV